MSHSKILQSRSQTSGSICPLNSSCCCRCLQHCYHSSRNTHYSKHKSPPDVGKLPRRWTASSVGTVCRLKISERLIERRFLSDYHRSPQNGSVFVETKVPTLEIMPHNVFSAFFSLRYFFRVPNEFLGAEKGPHIRAPQFSDGGPSRVLQIAPARVTQPPQRQER